MPQFEVQVIGAGWGRTGTASLKKALEILGYPCYHMFEVANHDHSPFWTRVADGEKYDFDEAFNLKDVQFTATVDFPSAPYWKEQLRRYPNAKVILSVRDPEKWYQSCLDTIFCMIGGSPHVPFGLWLCRLVNLLPYRAYLMTYKLVSRNIFLNNWDKKAIIDKFIAYNEEVKRECPAEKLLVFEVSEGWEPLCAFLNKPVPSQPFPHVNDTAQFRRRVEGFNVLGWKLLGLVVPGVLGMGLHYMRNRK